MHDKYKDAQYQNSLQVRKQIIEKEENKFNYFKLGFNQREKSCKKENC